MLLLSYFSKGTCQPCKTRLTFACLCGCTNEYDEVHVRCNERGRPMPTHDFSKPICYIISTLKAHSSQVLFAPLRA